MKYEYGRSLIEVIGILAIGGLMSVATIKMYQQVHTNNVRAIAATELEQIAKNVKLLTGARGTYEGVSVDYLIKSGARKSDAAPLGGGKWSVEPDIEGTSFSINLTELSSGECAYFALKRPTWADMIIINGQELNGTANCFSTRTNQISFIVK